MGVWRCFGQVEPGPGGQPRINHQKSGSSEGRPACLPCHSRNCRDVSAASFKLNTLATENWIVCTRAGNEPSRNKNFHILIVGSAFTSKNILKQNAEWAVTHGK